ncbi:hypothetical protein H9Q69_006356 [Fusarium xylarioides]|nr:hypothetical protein H9Q69_006356 [Fusarium xylarioides]
MARAKRSRVARKPTLAQIRRAQERGNHLVVAKPPRWQAVHRGLWEGVFPSWEQARRSVEGYRNAKYRAFDNKEEAFRYVREGSMSLGYPLPPPEPFTSPEPSPPPKRSASSRSSSRRWPSARRSPVAIRTPTPRSRSSISSRSPTGRVSISRSARNLGRPRQVVQSSEQNRRLEAIYKAINGDVRLQQLVEGLGGLFLDDTIDGDERIQQVIEGVKGLVLGNKHMAAQSRASSEGDTDYGDEDAEAIMESMEQDY